MQDPRLELLQISGGFWSTDLVHILLRFLVVEGDFIIQLDFLCRTEYQVLEKVIERLSHLLIPVQNTIGNTYYSFPSCDCFLGYPVTSFFSQGNTRLSQPAKISNAKRLTKREFAPVQQQSLVALPVRGRHITVLQVWEHSLSPVSCLGGLARPWHLWEGQPSSGNCVSAWKTSQLSFKGQGS